MGWKKERRVQAAGYSRRRVSGWTIAKRRNIERAHYESWCRYGCCFAIPRHLLFAHVCRKFRISGSPRSAAARWRRLLATRKEEKGEWMARGFCRSATGYVRKRWMILLRRLMDWFLVARRISVQHQFHRANDHEKVAPVRSEVTRKVRNYSMNNSHNVDTAKNLRESMTLSCFPIINWHVTTAQLLLRSFCAKRNSRKKLRYFACRNVRRK